MGAKAVAAAKKQAKKSGNGAFDESKMEILHEEDPIDAGRNGVISVEVFSYNGSDPGIGVYRYGVSRKTNKEWKVRDIKKLDHVQAVQLSKALSNAAKVLKKL